MTDPASRKPADAAHDGSFAGERAMLAEALETPLEEIRPVSRDPLGAGAVAGFDVLASDAEGDAAVLRYYLDTSRMAVAAETGLLLGLPEAPEARIWLHPADPHLPLLPSVAFHDAAGSLLARIGVRANEAPEFVAYRPGRRAVLRIAGVDDAGPRTLWLKVLRPSRAALIAERHEAAARAGLPVPRLQAWSPSGLVLLADAEGTAVADAEWSAEALLDEVERLMDRFAAVDLDVPARPATERLEWFAGRLAGSPRARSVAARSRALLEQREPDGRSRVVHGDLHYGQLFVDGRGRISGVIDVDTMGVGDRADDPSAFLAHAVASAMLTPPARSERVWSLVDGALRRWGGDPGVLGGASAQLLGHAMGAHDRGDPERAAHLLDAASAITTGASPRPSAPTSDHESPLIGISSTP